MTTTFASSREDFGGPPSPIVLTAGMDSQVVQLALAVGLFTPVEGVPDSYELNASWFIDPIGNSGAALQANGEALGALIGQLLGSVGGKAVGVPVKDPGMLGTWYPIQTTGLFLTTREDGAQTVFGIGTTYTWQLADGISIRAWGVVPLLGIGSDGITVVLGQASAPLSIGVEVVSTTTIIDQFGFSFSGVKLGGNLSLFPQPNPDLSIVVLQLKLPTDSEPSDRSLADLEQLTGEQLLSAISSLVLGALSKAMPTGSEASLASLLPVLGLSPTPAAKIAALFPGVTIPAMRWDLLAQAYRDGDLTRPFRDWFNALLSSADVFQAWLASIQGLEGVPTPRVTGKGTREEPFSAVILAEPLLGTLSFTAATTVAPDGTRTFYPGLNFAGAKIVLGESTAAVRVSAALELAQFRISAGDVAADPTSLAFDSGICLVGKGETDGNDDPLFSGTIDEKTYTFGALCAGLKIGNATGKLQIIPRFTFENVVTPNGSYASVDLTQPGSVLRVALTDLYGIIDAALRKLFGISGEKTAAGYSLATLIGIVPPDTGDPSIAWPNELAPPLSASQIAASIQDPAGAIVGYWGKLLSGSILVGGKTPFFYMVRQGALLLQQASSVPVIGVTGSGTRVDPWRAALNATPGLAAALQVFFEPLPDSATRKRLVIGFAFSPQLAFSKTFQVDLDVGIDALALDLDTGGSALPQAATIFPGIGLAVNLPNGFTSPAVAGASIDVAASGLSVYWSPYSGWQWSMHAGEPSLIVNGQEMKVGEDMVFTATAGLEKLVTQQAQTFARILTGLAGIAVYNTGTRSGLALNGILGLLPNLANFMPPKITWPAGMPVLSLTSFNDPLGALRAQINGFFTTADKARAMLQLLAWTASSDADAPEVPGSGTLDDPFHVPLSLASGVGLAVWFDAKLGTAGFGIDHSVAYALPQDLQAVTRVFLPLVNGSLVTGDLVAAAGVPGAVLRTTLRSTTGKLIPGDTFSIGAAVIGLSVSASFSGSTPAFPVTPLFELLDATLPNQETFPSINVALTTTPTDFAQALQQSLNLALQRVIVSAAGDSAFETVYRLLAQIGFAIPAATAGDPRGINPQGWLAFIADPFGFSSQRLVDLTTDAQSLADLVSILKQATGVTPPAIPDSVLHLLNAFGVLQDEAHGWVPIPTAIAELFSHPVRYLTAQFQALIADELRLAELVSKLVQIIKPIPFGPFTVEILAGPVVRLSIPPGKAVIAQLLDVSGSASLTFSPRIQTFALQLQLLNPQARVAVLPALTVDIASGETSFTLSMQWGDGLMPAPPPLKFWPFQSKEFVDHLAKVAPFYALSVFVQQVVDPLLLQPYPLVQVVFDALGIASKDTSGTWHTKSLLGLFDDPAAWLLSGAVLGANGQLNMARIRCVLGRMPAVKFPGLDTPVGTEQITNGFSVVGLPYGMAVDLTADATAELFTIRPRLAVPLAIAGNQARIETFSFGLSLAPDFQPGFDARIIASAQIPGLGSALAVTTGYDHAFLLSLGESAAGGVSLQLVPFPGWQTLLRQATEIAVQALLPELATQLLAGLHKIGAGQFADALSAAGKNLNVQALLEAMASVHDAPALQHAALKWLAGRLSTENADATAKAIVALLSTAGLTVEAEGGLISYRPSATLPVTLYVGATTSDSQHLVGAWVGLDLPKIALLQISIDRTGLGVPFDPETGVPLSAPPAPPVFSFGVALSTPIEGEDRAPTLKLTHDASKGFVLAFDLLGKPGTPSDLHRELLPDFFGVTPAAITDWLVAVLTQAVPRYVSLVVLNLDSVRTWLDMQLFPIPPGKVVDRITPGTVLDKAGLLELEGKMYALRSFDELSALTVPTFLANFLKALLGVQFTLITFGTDGKDGSIVVGPSTTGGSDLGVRIAARNLKLGAAPNFVLQLGASDTAWIVPAGGPPELVPGVGIFIPVTTTPELAGTKVEVVNVGVDFVGIQQKPLVELSRFSLGSVKPRGLLMFDFAASPKPAMWGGMVALDDIAISLAPNTAVSGEKTNPVAQNLLGSGQPGGSPEETGNNPPANPPFSALAAYVKGAAFPLVSFYDDTQTSPTELWLQVQRNFGPLAVDAIGMSWLQETTHLGVLFSGSVSLAGLFVGLRKLDVSFNVKEPTDYTEYELDLAGLDVSFKGGPVSITGAFFKQDEPLRYDGAALIRASTFGLDALGSYGVVNDAPSLFIFVNLNTPLGGIPELFVVGLAAGFGYNRDLVIPGPGDIGSFPLVAGAIDPNFFPKGADGKADPTTALAKLGDTVPSVIGQYWFGGGVRFTTYELLSTFALLFLKCGREFEIDVVGVMSASLPPLLPTIAYIELAIVASFKPSDGLVSVQAQLTPNSYVLAPQCKLTGGFAMVFWYSGPNAGNFVITLGGYHPSYEKPDIYPDVPRLGFVWPIDLSFATLGIIGGAYFAFTPAAFMAGGFLRVAFEMGPLRAWLDAGANFLIQWKPFYYEVDVHVSVGVEFRAEIAGVGVTLSATLGALLELWGPSTAGRAYVDWYVISFTIPIGDQDRSLQREPIATWDEFAASFLPPATSPDPDDVVLRAGGSGQAPGDVLKVSIEIGLISEQSPNGSVIDPSSWSFTIQTFVPATAMTVSGVGLPDGPPIGVRPMEVTSIDTPLKVTMRQLDAASSWVDIDLAAHGVSVAAVRRDSTAALWSKDALNTETPPDAASSLIAGTNTGVQITGATMRCHDPIGPIPLEEAFAFVHLDSLFYPRSPRWAASPNLLQDTPFATLMSTIMKPGVVAMRNAVLQALRDHNVAALADPQLSVIAVYATDIYQAPPTLAQIGADLSPDPAVLQLRPRPVRAALAVPAPEPAEVRLLGATRRYRSRARRKAVAAAGLPLSLSSARIQARWVDEAPCDAEREALAMFARAADTEGQLPLRFFEGSIAVCAIRQPEDARAVARNTGDLPVRVLALNRHDELLSDVIARGGDEVQLPEGTAKAALQSVGRADASTLVGWQRDTLLARVGRYTFLGDDCIVRPQATPIRRERGRVIPRGLFEAARVVDANRVRARGVARSGWLETILPPASTVVVSVAGSIDDAGSVRVRLAATDDPWNPRYGDDADVPSRTEAAAGGFVLFFDAPEGGANVAVLVETDLALQGVWGSARRSEPLAWWSDARPHAVAASMAARGGTSSVVTIAVQQAQEASR
jgi:hypothetical protein